jgi:hypothetical protein
MSIAATRMYRSLSDFLSPDMYESRTHSFLCSVLTVLAEHHGSSQKVPPPGGRNALESNRTSTAPILLTGIQVAVHTTHEQRSTPQANRFGSNIRGQPYDAKPHELIGVGIVNDHDIEGRKISRVTPTAE